MAQDQVDGGVGSTSYLMCAAHYETKTGTPGSNIMKNFKLAIKKH